MRGLGVRRGGSDLRLLFVPLLVAWAFAGGGEGCNSVPAPSGAAPDPELVGFLPGIGTALDVVVDGTEAFVASAEFGVTVVEATAASPALLGSADLPFHSEHVAIAGNRAVAAGQDEALAHLRVLDVSNATQPLVLGELATTVLQSVSTGFQDLALDTSGTRAVAAMGTAGLWVIDLANPAAPKVIGTYDTPGTAWGVALIGTVAYVADGSSGLRILSLANPSQPTLLGTLSLSGVMRDIAVSGSTAYLANQQGGFRVVNVASPSAPAFLASVSGSASFRLSVSGNRLGVYQPTSAGGSVAIYNVTNPASPALLATLSPTDARGITLSGNLAYVPDGSAGLSVYDLGSGSTPGLSATVPLVGSALDVDVAGTHVRVADSLAGVALLE